MEETVCQKNIALVSVIIPTKNEEKHISSCIESLENSDYPRNKFELIIIDGGSIDKTVDIVKKLQEKYKNICLICADGFNISVGRNIGIKSASGTIIINFSGHAIAEKNFIRILSTKLSCSENKIMGVGCKDRMPLGHLSFVAQCIEFIINTKIGGTTMHQQMEFHREQFVDSISFSAYRREIFEKIGFFDPDLPLGDDAEFNLRIKRAGYKLLYTPITCVYRYRREKLNEFFWQIFNYGRSRMQIIKKHPSSIRLVYIIPIFFPLYIFALPALFLLNNLIFFTIWIMGGFVYFLLLFGFSIKLSISNSNPKLFFICPFFYFIEHLAYGSGLFLGMLYFKGNSHKTEGSG